MYFWRCQWRINFKCSTIYDTRGDTAVQSKAARKLYDPSLVYIIAGKLSPLRCQNEGRLWNKRAKADDKFAVHKTADGLRQQSKLVDNQDMGLQFACRMSSSSHERVRSTADSSLLLRAFIFTVIGSLVKIILWPPICPSESFGLSAAASFQIFFCWKTLWFFHIIE